ncbi:MAG TPA: NAD-dependent epimerase/dehydratase family protein [Stellaceae bacterium]
MTGAAGFIGRGLCGRLARQGHRVSGLTREAAEPIAGVALRAIGEIGPQTDWRSHLAGVDIVVHLATSAHRPISAAAGAIEAKTAAILARAARAAGVGRLVHVSSIRAMGEATAPGERFHPADPPSPRETYGRIKLAIEGAIAATASCAMLDLVILRPPLVYGPGVKGNFRSLIRLAASGVPLPLAGFDAPRSLIFLDNLVDLLGLACVHPAAPGRVLLARDAVDLTLPELLRAVGLGFGRRVRLYRVRPKLVAGLAVIPTLATALRRLSQPLLVDDGETRSALGWAPAVATEDGLALTARAWARPV